MTAAWFTFARNEERGFPRGLPLSVLLINIIKEGTDWLPLASECQEDGIMSLTLPLKAFGYVQRGRKRGSVKSFAWLPGLLGCVPSVLRALTRCTLPTLPPPAHHTALVFTSGYCTLVCGLKQFKCSHIISMNTSVVCVFERESVLFLAYELHLFTYLFALKFMHTSHTHT